jgi:DNA polymerase III subunit beta
MNLHLKIDRNLLSLAMARVQGAMAERNLAYVGLKAKNGRLYVSAADQSLAIYNDFPCDVMEDGLIFVPAKLFSDLARELPEGSVELLKEQAYLKVSAGPAKEFVMKIPIIDDGNWREIPTVNYDNTATISVTKLSYMIEQVNSCISVDSPRNYGTVAFLHRPTADKSSLRLVGTDSFRLSFCDIRVDMPDVFLKAGVSLTKRALAELSRLASEGFENVTLSISDDQTTLVAQVPSYQIFVRLSAVKYPNYSSVVPDLKQRGVLMSTNHMKSVARRVLLAADKSRVLQLSFSDASLTLSSKNTAHSESKERISLEGYHGSRCDIAINGKYITDIVGVTGAEKMSLQFKDAVEPIVLTPYGEPTDCSTKHILVPITGGAEAQA